MNAYGRFNGSFGRMGAVTVGAVTVGGYGSLGAPTIPSLTAEISAKQNELNAAIQAGKKFKAKRLQNQIAKLEKKLNALRGGSSGGGGFAAGARDLLQQALDITQPGQAMPAETAPTTPAPAAGGMPTWLPLVIGGVALVGAAAYALR